jgi:hypothetical protein
MPRIHHPYGGLTGGRWLKGNLHAHSTQSDGERPLQQVIDAYAALGHGFCMISDHDTFTGPKQYAPLDRRGMHLLPGNEISAGGPHLLHVGAARRIEPTPQRQRVLDAIGRTRGFAVVNHPNWGHPQPFEHCSIDRMREWVGYAGLEIYNGVIGRLPGSPYATDKWDMLLTEGRRLWGFAHDDSHKADGDTGHGCNVAYVKERTVAGVLEALESGRFYGSTGVVITGIKVRGATIHVATENAQRVVAIGPGGRRLAVADDDEITFDVPDGVAHVRFECWGHAEQFAWTQPFFASG